MSVHILLEMLFVTDLFFIRDLQIQYLNSFRHVVVVPNDKSRVEYIDEDRQEEKRNYVGLK